MPEDTLISCGYNGETFMVPRSVYQKGQAKSWIEKQVADRQKAEAARIEAERNAALAASTQAMELAALKEQFAAQAAELAQLREANEKLQSVGADGAASAMALMAATRDASELRFQMQRDLTAMQQWGNENLAAVHEVSSHLRETRSAEAAAREERRQAMREHLQAQASQQVVITDNEP